MRSFVSASFIAIAVAGSASAQDAPGVGQAAPSEQSEPGPGPGDEIIVIAERIPGQVVTDVPPVLELEEKDIAAYGAASIADLVAQLSPQVGSGRGRGGRPVFLVNGQRISSFREMGRYPPEAIRKVEVLPEEVAVQFGYPPDQRVINFILKPNFASREIEAEYGMPTRGGYSAQELEASILTIDAQRRVNASIDYSRKSPLTEGERGVVQSVPTDPAVAAAGLDPADFRTLVSREESVEANATLTQGLGEMGRGGQLTVNGQVSRVVRDSLSGIDAVTLDPIERRTATDAYAIGSAFNRQLGDWRLSTTLDANRTDSDSRIDRRGGGGMDRALSRTWSASPKATLAGSPFALPAGSANLTLDAGFDWARIESSDSRTAALGETRLTRGNANGGASLSLPVASRRDGVLSGIGDLSVNFGGGIDHLSDFGTLTDWNAGLNWSPVEKLSLQASIIGRKAAPGLGQLGSPAIVDFNVPVYDFTTGDTVLATVTTGGNPNLRAETQRDIKLSANYDLDLFDRANILVEYYRNRSTDTTESFPLLTPAIEAAFPGRVTRAADGTLLALDRRPVTFSERESSRIRYGVNLFGRVGKPNPQAARGGGGSGFGRGPAAEPASAPSGAVVPPVIGRPGGGQFDPARFAEMRTRFCATPDGQMPDLSGVPAGMLDRLKGEDGEVDPAKVAALKTRFCTADGAPREGGGPARLTPERFAALRSALRCGEDGKEPDVAALPPEVVERIKGPDGTIDPARLAELRTRLCAIPVPPAGDTAQGQAGEGRQRPGGGPRGGPGGGGGPGAMFGGRGDGQGRWNLSLYHTIQLDNSVLVAPGGPALDLLDGDGLSDGGIPRHALEFEGGLFKDGIGTRLSGRYAGPTTVRGSGLPGSGDLRFGALATFDLRVFVNLEQQEWLTGTDGPGAWKGMRLGLRVNNLFDAQQRVTDENGAVPLRYQPGLVDPVGRYVEIELRKLF
ncbi:TonB-dependent receptor plug domain-containing protein [Tsuneonella sp. SYSU-LHT278]|uniref:TonB-dependent receptor plug domain-containing protein n=1 Tax=Tsuneonella sediminis TaxID=3416089 RepID=UPI003F7AC10E